MESSIIDKLILFSHFEFDLYKKRKGILTRKLATNVLAKRTIEGEIEEFTFFYSSKRKDQNRLFEKIYSSCPYRKTKLVLKRKTTLNGRFLLGFISNFSFFHTIRRTLNKYYGTVKVSLREQLYIYIDYLAQEDFLRSVKKQNIDKLKVFVVLADVLLFEQTAVCYFNTKNISTVTAQHGIFFWQDDFSYVQKLNYYNAPSKYVLTWGENTSKLFNRLSPDTESIICGNPLLVPKRVQVKNFIAVSGDTVNFIDENKKMIEIAELFAKNHSMDLYVRLHPADREENYVVDTDITQFRKDIDEAQFILSHTSSMLCQYISEGRRVFRYKSKIELDYVPSTIEFTNINELEELVKSVDINAFHLIAVKNIAYCGEDSMRKYGEAFNYIRKNNVDSR